MRLRNAHPKAKIILLSCLFLLLALLVGPFFIPIPPLKNTKPISELADPDSRFVKINGLQVHYKMLGQGQPVFILLHGFGSNLFSWHKVMGPLSEHGTVIAYDRPAFGLTERPMTWTGTNPYGTQSNLDLLLGLLDHFNVREAILVGNSAGGTVAMQFYLEHPDRVKALILIDPAVFNGGAPGWVKILYKLPQVQHLGPLFVRSIQQKGPELIKMAWHDPSRLDQETLDHYEKPLQAENWDRALWYFTLANQGNQLIDQFNEFNLPILLVSGDDDRIIPTNDTIKLSKELVNSELVVIKACGHVPQEEQPDALMKAVNQFLVDHP